MEIKVLPLGLIAANCYMISSNEAAIVIDPGKYSPLVAEFLIQNKPKERAILLTHSHFDHICGAKQLRDETASDIIVSKKDEEGLFNTYLSLSDQFHAKQTPFHADKTVIDGEFINIGDLKIKCIETPGHTPGSMCFLIGNELFSGDTLFSGSIGRTDFPGSNHFEMLSSLKKLSAFSKTINVYPGHGESTTIGEELLSNPYFSEI
ncbi:MAG: MBL fold metallo-hydrolase [Clostridia bacterium]|nr:MBL fold metallo-hydrolase [Clostridia bacterium]MEE1185014.1 MBL fold metallo-hydrolase [Acutalibacteraceae bacterium]